MFGTLVSLGHVVLVTHLSRLDSSSSLCVRNMFGLITPLSTGDSVRGAACCQTFCLCGWWSWNRKEPGIQALRHIDKIESRLLWCASCSVHRCVQILKTLHRTYSNMKLKPVWSDMNPKAVSTDELFGFLHPATREWKDGERVNMCMCMCRRLLLYSVLLLVCMFYICF